MKSTLAFVIGAAALLAGCGQPGPLYMPKPPARPAPAATPVQPPALPVVPATSPTPAAQ